MSPVLKYDPPRDAIETQITAIWAERLAAPRIGIHDHFTDLGGHSVEAAEMVTLIANQFRLRDASQDLLRLATVAEQAAYVRARLAG